MLRVQHPRLNRSRKTMNAAGFDCAALIPNVHRYEQESQIDYVKLSNDFESTIVCKSRERFIVSYNSDLS